MHNPDVTIDDLVKLGYTPDPDFAVDCTALPTGTCVKVIDMNGTRSMRLADYIADISQKIQHVEFHNEKQKQQALQADLHLYRAARMKLAAAINIAFFTAAAVLSYHFQNISVYASAAFFGILPVLYGFTDSSKELITKHFLKN